VTAWSTEYDYKTDTFRPLFVQSNPFCAGGMLLPDGRLTTLGGAEQLWTADVGGTVKGTSSIRLYEGSGSPGSFGTTDWLEDPGNSKLLMQVCINCFYLELNC
jgi:hypothetical protein